MRPRAYNTKPNSTSFKKGHAKVGGFGKGSRHTEDAKKLISKSLYGKRGKFARRWKGDLVGYVGIHLWVRRQLGRATMCVNLDCPKKFTKRFEWSSISGECKRDLSDFIQLCTGCHRRFDNGNLVIRTKDNNYKRDKIVAAECPKCNHKFEITL